MNRAVHLFCFTVLFSCYGFPFLEAALLECKQCSNFKEFLNGTLNGVATDACSNKTLCMAETHVCMKFYGKVGGFVGGKFVEPVIQYGCANRELLNYFGPSGQPYKEAGACQKTSGVRLPLNPAQASDLQLRFIGTYCYCHTGLCNNSAGKMWFSGVAVVVMCVLGYLVQITPW
ncbi:uncharacterized protein LOC129595889 [Paramacrobiotus metropolitanus]|uniref:uncharacterized protein LOC129595889 n=1 Tax=Paramacrobiotus metropolitanus TaxID=2943436 RepID=UPI0024465AAD|nr:uncharacterized protein LOC129595889 [Paramacrobiotus metropolitanus]